MIDRTALREKRQCRYLEHLPFDEPFTPLVKSTNTINQEQPYDIVELVLSRHIDKLRVSFDFRYYQTIKDRLSQNLETKPTHMHESGLYQDYCIGESKVSLIIWTKNKFYFSLELHDASYENQLFLINNILKDTPRTLSLVEYAHVLTPKNWYELEELRRIIETGLTYPRARKIGFCRIGNTSYYCSNGQIRKHKSKDGKEHTVSSGLRIYYEPKGAEVPSSLKIEIVLYRHHLKQISKKSSINSNGNGVALEYTKPVTPSDVELSNHMTYRSFDDDKLFNTKIMKKYWLIFYKKHPKVPRSLSDYQQRNRIILAKGNKTSIHNNDLIAAMPVQMYNLKKLNKQLAQKALDYFPLHLKQQFIFDDIKNGFVRTKYLPDLFCLSCESRRCEKNDPVKINGAWGWADGF